MKDFTSRCLFACLSLVLPAVSHAAGPKLVSVEKIWDKGEHNAFTDLIRWHGRWYCTFRESEAHVGGDGKIRVIESIDGKSWDSAALVAEEGIDLRDPKISVTPDDRLMIVAGGSVYQGTKTLKGRQPRVMFSKDGHSWTPPRRVLADGDWLWRVTWHEGKAYGASYVAHDKKLPDEWDLGLYVSTNGVDYKKVTDLKVPGRPNETTLRFMPDGEMVALARREGGNTFGWIGRSRPPYTDWRWTETAHRLGGPNFIRLPDGSLWAAGRTYPGGAKTAVAKMSIDGGYEPVLTLPSGGDTSYPGLVWHEGQLWMSYYSSHEGKSAIYLAKVEIPLEAEEIGKRLEPFVDDFLIDRLQNARLVVQQPEPKELVFTADRPWEGNTSAYYSVFRDGDLFRMYYRGSHFDEVKKKGTHREVTCYAESCDGVHWTKPDLGLFEFDGSKQNNIVWDGPGTHNFAPFRDDNPAAPAEARYKALALGQGGLLALRSADAIHWTRMSDKPVITRGAFDSQNLAFWDAYKGLYRGYHRDVRNGLRDILTETSPDFLKWTEPAFLEYATPNTEHLYTNTVRPYFRAPHILIGFPTRFLPAKEQTEPTFMTSRDGRHFLRYPEAVIPRTAPADRDGNRSNYMAWGLVQLPGKEHEGELSVYGKEAYYKGPGSRLRRFAYRLDGFVALHGGSEGGEAVTRPVRFEGSRLILNSRTGPNGSIRVEVQSADGSAVHGFEASDARPLQGDHLAASVSWPGADLASLAGRPVRLRFVLQDADVFSFRFE
ncbi:MAG: exo-alpha-sialidase [Isosphaeraceae bacterium]